MKVLYAFLFLTLASFASSDEEADGSLALVGEPPVIIQPGEQSKVMQFSEEEEAAADGEEEPSERKKRTVCPAPYFDAACFAAHGYVAPYRCANGRGCAYPENICNRISECSDGSDECNCLYPTVSSYCARRYYPFIYRCNSGSQCLREAGICNGVEDCSDGSDERHCRSAFYDRGSNGCHDQFGSRGSSWRCADQHACLPGNRICDGVRDCAYGSDEIACTPS